MFDSICYRNTGYTIDGLYQLQFRAAVAAAAPLNQPLSYLWLGAYGCHPQNMPRQQKLQIQQQRSTHQCLHCLSYRHLHRRNRSRLTDLPQAHCSGKEEGAPSKKTMPIPALGPPLPPPTPLPPRLLSNSISIYTVDIEMIFCFCNESSDPLTFLEI